MDKMKVNYEVMLGLYAEFVLDEAIRKYKEEHLYIEIDNALAKGDEPKFLELTNELKALRL
ncbi:IDEAL domain-containing protein [Paenibacillus gansuensis]|uniref:IDEAL domain-containing protein n=1 Tax=Paenibacillus gansuensis TaxID=306542 RepID=A0ABW5PCJ7_9BACL